MSLHINVLELLTVWKVIQHFAPLLQNQHVLIRTDNKATAAHINQQGGVRSAQLLMVDRNLAFSTVKTYAAAISSCHEGFGDRSVFSHPLMKRFLRGVWRHRPVSRSLAPQWDLALVLRALIKAPFKPLDQVPLKFLAAKTALLLALTSAQRVSDLHALSVAPSCLRTQGDGSSAVLRPKPAFTPKSITSSFRSRVINLDGFFPPLHNSEEEATSHLLCPVSALSCYVAHTAASSRTQRLFLHYREQSLGLPLSAQRLSHWLCEAVFYRHISPLGWIPRRASECTPPEESHPPRLCMEE